MENQVESSLIVGPDDPVPAGEATLLGLQHVLAMDVYVPPIILAGMMAMGATDSTGLLQSTFLAAGFGTILQTCFFMKMPVSQGPSFVPLGAAAGVVMASGGLKGNGMATLLGAPVLNHLKGQRFPHGAPTFQERKEPLRTSNNFPHSTNGFFLLFFF